MSGPNYDDPTVESQWCADRRADVELYLASEAVDHGRIGEGPAWHIAPYVAVWAIESKSNPGGVGWWVICGDMPTDYVSAAGIHHPREVLKAVADRWRHHCDAVRSGKSSPGFTIGPSGEDALRILPFLESRSSLLARWARDDSLWESL